MCVCVCVRALLRCCWGVCVCKNVCLRLCSCAQRMMSIYSYTFSVREYIFLSYSIFHYYMVSYAYAYTCSVLAATQPRANRACSWIYHENIHIYIYTYVVCMIIFIFITQYFTTTSLYLSFVFQFLSIHSSCHATEQHNKNVHMYIYINMHILYAWSYWIWLFCVSLLEVYTILIHTLVGQVLSDYNKIVFLADSEEDQALLEHEKTDEEVTNCFLDLRVLGKGRERERVEKERERKRERDSICAHVGCEIAHVGYERERERFHMCTCCFHILHVKLHM